MFLYVIEKEKVAKENIKQKLEEELIKKETIEREERKLIQEAEIKIDTKLDRKKQFLRDCECGLSKVCNCNNPEYIIVKLNKQLICKNCENWKCRCI